MTLYILFINDLVPEIPKGVHAALYADDVVLWCSEVHGTDAITMLQASNTNRLSKLKKSTENSNYLKKDKVLQ